MTTTYTTGDLDIVNEAINKWCKSSKNSEDMFIHTFSEDFDVHGVYFSRFIENTQTDLSIPEYPNDVVLTLKHREDNPTNPNMTKWGEEYVKKYGYLFIVAKKFNLDF